MVQDECLCFVTFLFFRIRCFDLCNDTHNSIGVILVANVEFIELIEIKSWKLQSIDWIPVEPDTTD